MFLNDSLMKNRGVDIMLNVIGGKIKQIEKDHSSLMALIQVSCFRLTTWLTFLMAFVEKIPVELSTEIFLHVSGPVGIPFGMMSSQVQLPTTYANPYILGAICQSWRNLAWSTPTLWSCVYLNASRRRMSNMLELLESWLDRSKDSPLDIIFMKKRYIGAINKHFDINASTLFTVLLKESHRWKTISLTGDEVGPLIDILSQYQDKLPQLDRVHFREDPRNIGQIRPIFLPLTHIDLDFSPTLSSPISSSRITCLHFLRILFPELMSILSICHNTLRYLSLVKIWGSPESNSQEDAVVFPHLQSLKVHMEPNIDATLSKIKHAPKLSSLSVSYKPWYHSDPPLDTFLNRAGASLRLLCISISALGSPPPTGHLHRLLQSQSSTLEELCFYVFFQDVSYDCLIPPLHAYLHCDISTTALPRLQFYTFSAPPSLRSSRDPVGSCFPILSMAESRLQAFKNGLLPVPLKRLTLSAPWWEEAVKEAKHHEAVLSLIKLDESTWTKYDNEHELPGV